MAANKRITDAVLDGDYIDGQVLFGEDLNRIIEILKAGVNANKADLDKILTGETSSYVVYSLTALGALLETEVVPNGKRGYVFNPESLGDGINLKTRILL